MDETTQPFGDLPESLVEEMLNKAEEIGDSLYNVFVDIEEKKEEIRRQLLDNGVLKKSLDLSVVSTPTTCGIDGSYAIEKLLSLDLVACAAVAVEGLTPPSEERHWEKPHHQVFIDYIEHSNNTSSIVRGLMMEMEIDLAINAPHDIVFLDGSLVTPLIYLNQAINKALELETESSLKKELFENFARFLDGYEVILNTTRSDKIWVGAPKYTTNKELGEKLGWPSNYDDRAILTSILEAGEFISPFHLKEQKQPWHLKTPEGKDLNKFDNLIKNIHIIYYKPYAWTPAIRLEIAPFVATNDHMISSLLRGVQHQFSTPGIFEPYPLYMADRMVKHLGKSLPIFRQTATKRMTDLYKGEDMSTIFLNMHGYRTDTGR